ncbi:MAG: hypothetical protein RJA70_810 [Pseudomonadota bacterium]|jgi:ABC-type uncharacterized transport system permease subunit
MQSLALIAFLLGVVTYSVSGTLYFVDLARREGASNSAAWAPRVLSAGTVFHLIHVVTASRLAGFSPTESLPFALSLSALMTNVIYLLMRERAGIGAMGVVVAPLALMFLLAEQFVGQLEAAPELPRLLLGVHVTANLLGLGLFLLAGVAGAFYLVQERRLKRKLSFAGLRLPALDRLDLAEHRLLLAGFPLQTLGVVTGAVFIAMLGDTSATALLRALLAFGTWAVVGGVLVTRATLGWRGRRSAYGTLAGVTCVLLVIAIYVARAGVSL